MLSNLIELHFFLQSGQVEVLHVARPFPSVGSGYARLMIGLYLRIFFYLSNQFFGADFFFIN